MNKVGGRRKKGVWRVEKPYRHVKERTTQSDRGREDGGGNENLYYQDIIRMKK